MIEQTDIFVDINVPDYILASTLWEMLKAYLRGEIVAHNMYTRKKYYRSTDELSSKIKALDSVISTSSTPDLIKKRQVYKLTLNS